MTVQEDIERRLDTAIPPVQFRHIVVALDGSKQAESILPYVQSLAGVFNSTITCVCALAPVTLVASGETGFGDMAGAAYAAESLLETEEALRKENKNYMDEIQRELETGGFEVTCREPEDRPADAILSIVDQEDADLIAMTTHGRSGLSRFLIGSVADDVLRHAECPVLIVHPAN